MVCIHRFGRCCVGSFLISRSFVYLTAPLRFNYSYVVYSPPPPFPVFYCFCCRTGFFCFVVMFNFKSSAHLFVCSILVRLTVRTSAFCLSFCFLHCQRTLSLAIRSSVPENAVYLLRVHSLGTDCGSSLECSNFLSRVHSLHVFLFFSGTTSTHSSSLITRQLVNWFVSSLNNHHSTKNACPPKACVTTHPVLMFGV